MVDIRKIMNNIPSGAGEVIKRIQAEKNLKDFVQQAWPILYKGKPAIWNWHLDALCEHLMCVTATYIENSGLIGKMVDKDFAPTQDASKAIWKYDVPERFVGKPINNLLINVPPRHGKQLADSTDIFTPDGWRKHGDIKPGDYVFHPSGRPVKVLAERDSGCIDNYVVEFTNGDKIRCHGNHEWTIYGRSQKKWMTVETRWFLEKTKSGPLAGQQRKLTSGKMGKRGGRYQYQVQNIESLQFPDADLPIDPYFLGVWLGDGYSSNSAFCYHPKYPELRMEIERRGMRPTSEHSHPETSVVTVGYGHQGIRQSLKDLGIFNDKHIPELYLWSSVKQRIDLLAGLIDSDGHVDKKGRVIIVTTLPKIKDTLMDLLVSLGQRPYVVEYEPVSSTTMNIHGKLPSYHIGFQPTIFIPTQVKHKKIKRLVKQRMVSIKSVIYDPENGEHGKCIQVDSPDGLYLAGKNLTPTHNSNIINIFWPAWEWGPQRLPFLKYMKLSYQQHLSTRDSLSCKRVIESDWYQKNWGHVFKLSEAQNAKVRYDNDAGGASFATSTNSYITGDGGDRVICDDPLRASDAGSIHELNRVIDLWKDSLSTRIDNPNLGTYITVMQRIHPIDLSGYLIEQRDNGSLPDLNHLCLPARYEKDHPHKSSTILDFVDPRTEEGEPLDKNRFPDKVLKGLEGSFSLHAAAGQLQQRPRMKEGNLIMVERIKLIDDINKEKIKKTMRFWDKAASEAAGSSKTVGVKLGLMEEGYGFSYVVLDVVSGLWSYGKRNEVMRYTAEKDGLTTEIIIEQEPGSGGKESAIANVKETFAGFKCSIDKVSGSKSIRLEAFATQVEMYNVACLKRDWTSEYLKGLEDCFAGGTVSDFGDATSGAFNWISGVAAGQKKKRRIRYSIL